MQMQRRFCLGGAAPKWRGGEGVAEAWGKRGWGVTHPHSSPIQAPGGPSLHRWPTATGLLTPPPPAGSSSLHRTTAPSLDSCSAGGPSPATAASGNWPSESPQSQKRTCVKGCHGEGFLVAPTRGWLPRDRHHPQPGPGASWAPLPPSLPAPHSCLSLQHSSLAQQGSPKLPAGWGNESSFSEPSDGSDVLYSEGHTCKSEGDWGQSSKRVKKQQTLTPRPGNVNSSWLQGVGGGLWLRPERQKGWNSAGRQTGLGLEPVFFWGGGSDCLIVQSSL